jgi:biofilm PGA synthesis protein PgaA
LPGAAELFARETPLRALRHGITANAASTNVAYRESESREFRLGTEAMDFSDGNLRTGVAGQYTERLMTRPRFTLDGILGLGTSRNSADSNRPYFNPRQDATVTYGLSLNQALYRRYELLYDHHLVVSPGLYWQQDFGQNGIISALYEHRVRANDTVEAGLGVSFSRRPYDGNYESTVAVLFNARLRF